MDRILQFNLWGDYAHFKKYYTTTSPLTFEFPPPPTVIGIISAIIGLDKNDNFYLTKFPEDSYKLAIKLDKPVKKVRWSLNLIHTKDIKLFRLIRKRGHEPHTPIRTEFLKDPSFTIYFWHRDDDIYQSLKQRLESHSSVYSISLGLSELLANYEYKGEKTISEYKNEESVQIDSAIPSRYIPQNGIDYEIGKEIFQVNYPVSMNCERVVEKRSEVIFERNGKPIKCSPNIYWQLETGEKIVFF
jgi:CRISPR-associated protein Cas5h